MSDEKKVFRTRALIKYEVKCDNCGHKWDYYGEHRLFLRCPKCRSQNISLNPIWKEGGYREA